jgi:hypothetical protein
MRDRKHGVGSGFESNGFLCHCHLHEAVPPTTQKVSLPTLTKQIDTSPHVVRRLIQSQGRLEKLL